MYMLDLSAQHSGVYVLEIEGSNKKIRVIKY